MTVLLGETDRWLFLNKPAGLSVFPLHNHPDSDCLLARLRLAMPQQHRSDWPRGFEGGIAHRLDIPTSGLVIAARTPDDLSVLRTWFSLRRLTKTYQLLTARDVAWDSRELSVEIGHDKRRKKRMIVRRGKNTPHRGRWYSAQTAFRRLGRCGPLWCWEAIMHTGVTHQIRAHAGFAGLALVGDRLYGGGDTPAPFPVPFALHHVQLTGPGIRPPSAPLPDWWPAPSP
ncbi:MAG: RNA pseudouridine synthase [Myxococcota bacterium]